MTARNYPEALRMARAAGTDAGNRSARRHGRAAWAPADYDAACDAMHTALEALGYAA